MIRRLAIVATLLLAAGCGGGGSSIPASNTTVTAPGAPQSAGTANATLSIVIPSATDASSSSRQPKYVSPATQSLSFAPRDRIADRGSARRRHARVRHEQQRDDVLRQRRAADRGHRKSFVVSTYAEHQRHRYAALDHARPRRASSPVNPTRSTSPSAAYRIGRLGVPHVGGSGRRRHLDSRDRHGQGRLGQHDRRQHTVRQCAGNAVTISLSDTDASSGTKISPATLTAPGSATVAYDNYFQPTSALITASATGITNATATIAFAAKPLAYTFTYTDTLQLMAIGRSHAPADKSRRNAQTVQVYPLTLAALLPTGNAAHPYALGTNVTTQASGYAYMGFSSFGMATAPSGHLYFTERGSQYGTFDAGTTPTLPASSTVIGGAATQTIGPIALGPGGIMWAGVKNGTNEGIAQINPVTGAIVGNLIPLPSQFIQTKIPQAIAVGPDGSVYIDAFDTTNGNNCEVAVFTGTGGSLSYAREFWTGNIHYSSDAVFGIAVDIHNQVYVSADYNGTIDVVPASSSGNVLPSMVYSNDNTYDDGENLVVDAAGNIVWTIDEGILVIAPNTGAVPPGGTNPANPFVPATDSPVLQTVSGTNSTAQFSNITSGPGF